MKNNLSKFWIGQTISSFGSAFTGFALPLLVLRLTNSSFSLGLTTALTFLPPVLFGVFIGAWMDRVDRKRMMIFSDVARAFTLILLCLLSLFQMLSIWWIYIAAFVCSFLAMCFETCQFSAISSIVPPHELTKANGRLRASYTIATIIGTLLAGAVILGIPLPMLFFLDAITFIIAAYLLKVIPISFNAPANQTQIQEEKNIWHAIKEGISFVWHHPILRYLTIMLTILNFLFSTINAQFTLFAQKLLNANEAEISLLFSAGGVGVIILSITTEHLKKRLSYSQLLPGSFMALGILIVILASIHWYWATLSLWSLIQGCEALFNIILLSLTMPIIPQEMMGRATSAIRVLAWSAIPLGTLLGGWLIEITGQVAITYGVIGGLLSFTTFLFLFTPLRHADRYVSETVTLDDSSSENPG